MCEEEKVQCSGCEYFFEPNEIGQDGLCDPCNEVDDTPTSGECDRCPNTATVNIAGTNLCENCQEHFHH